MHNQHPELYGSSAGPTALQTVPKPSDSILFSYRISHSFTTSVALLVFKRHTVKMHSFSFAYALQLHLPLQCELEPGVWWECHLWSPGSTEKHEHKAPFFTGMMKQWTKSLGRVNQHGSVNFRGLSFPETDYWSISPHIFQKERNKNNPHHLAVCWNIRCRYSLRKST